MTSPDEPIIRLKDFLPYRLSVVSNAVSSRIANAYAERFGLDIPEWRLIAILAELKKAVPQDLGRTTRMDKITVSRAARRLLERGLVVRTPNARDGRSHFLSLSDEGRALYARVAPIALALEAKLLKEFTLAEIGTLSDLLKRLEAAALSD